MLVVLKELKIGCGWADRFNDLFDLCNLDEAYRVL